MTDTSNRTRVTKGVPQGGEFAAEIKAENPDLTTPFEFPEVPAILFRDKDNKVTGGMSPREVESVLRGLSPIELGDIIEETKAAARKDRELVVPPRLVGILRTRGLVSLDGDEMRVHTERFTGWLQGLWEHPTWVQDGKTPHPTGGYVECRRRVDEKGMEFQTYLDADGERHREDGPSKRITDGEGVEIEYWSRHGRYEREIGLPAFVDRSHGLSTMMWYRNNKPVARVEGLEPGLDLSELQFPS